MKTSGFLNPVEIRNLITANTNENAPHFVFMTDHGTIFGHDPSSSHTSVRKFGAFAGTTWLRHSKSISEIGSASPEPDFGLNGTTLKVVISKDGRGMHHMVVRVDDMVAAVFPVRERCLLAALMEREGDDDGCDQAESATGVDKTALNDSEEHQDGASDDGSSSSHRLSNTSSPPTSHPQPQLSKLRILELRAEAMAEAFRDEICGSNFKMPAEFR